MLGSNRLAIRDWMGNSLWFPIAKERFSKRFDSALVEKSIQLDLATLRDRFIDVCIADVVLLC